MKRRDMLKLAGLAGAGWLTGLADALARQAEQGDPKSPAQSVILLWMAGGPSQLETFDPHPGREIGGPTKDIATAAKGLRLAQGFQRLAEQMGDVSLVRSMKTKEGDHERGTYLVKTGYVPDPTTVHPSIGAVCCHELPELAANGKRTEIPRHISILPNQWPGRGGDLGDEYDAFKTFDPVRKPPDVTPRVPDERFQQRLADMQVVERAFALRRSRQVRRSLHLKTVERATAMMSSEQLQAFDVMQEPEALRDRYGATPFGRGCLAARRLIQVGVRCVEVTLGGWDTHANNFEGCAEQIKLLDPAFAALIADLKEHKLLDKTIVLCAGEFGRTPRINGLDGRDHWPHGFSLALAGGGLAGGRVIGETDPAGGKEITDPQTIQDVHATVYAALGIDYAQEYISHAQRPIKFSEGAPIKALLKA